MFITLCFCCAGVVYCQESKDRVIITVGIGAEEITSLFDTEYYTAAKVAVNAKIVGSKARLGGKFVFDRFYYSKRYSVGPELSYHLKFVEPYAHILIGKEYVNSSNVDDFVRTVGAGVRLNFGYLTYNVVQVDSTRGLRAPLASPGTTQFSTSLGIRF